MQVKVLHINFSLSAHQRFTLSITISTLLTKCVSYETLHFSCYTHELLSLNFPINAEITEKSVSTPQLPFQVDVEGRREAEVVAVSEGLEARRKLEQMKGDVALSGQKSN